MDCAGQTPMSRNPDTGLASSVILAQAGIQYTGGNLAKLDSRSRGNDGWKLRDELRHFHPGRVCATAGEELGMTGSQPARPTYIAETTVTEDAPAPPPDGRHPLA